MTNLLARPPRWLAAALGLLLCAAARAPQDPPPPPGPEPEPPTPVEALEGLRQTEDEMVQLFQDVERRLREIDRMLFDASAGRPLTTAEESGIDKLLRDSMQSSREVQQGIDRILELAQQRAQQQQQQQQQGGGQQQGQQGDSPLDQQQRREGQREQTPEGPSPERPEQPHPEGGRPESPQESPGEARNREGQDPPEGPTERTAAQGGDDRWGDLPVHVRDLFRAQGGGDLPPRYRDWIDAYYRRLSEKP